MNDQNETPPENSKPETNSLKAAAIEIFKKSQRLPPIALLMRKTAKAKAKRRSERPQFPPHAFEFGDFYHL